MGRVEADVAGVDDLVDGEMCGALCVRAWWRRRRLLIVV
jgi:hypothetical protein